jgi:hypothetical protein
MADLTNTIVANNYKKFVSANGIAGKTLIVSISKTNMTHADLSTIVDYMTSAHGVDGSGDSAFTVAGFGTATGAAFESGVTDVVYVALQGTGEFTAADQDAGVSGATVAVVAVFNQTPA